MWSRAKRQGKGSRLEESVWRVAAGIGEVEVDENEVKQGALEAEERAYLSEGDEVRDKVE
jgi:hypothetical protein